MLRGGCGRGSPENEENKPKPERQSRSRHSHSGPGQQEDPEQSRRTQALLPSLILPKILPGADVPSVAGLGACMRMCFHPSL